MVRSTIASDFSMNFYEWSGACLVRSTIASDFSMIYEWVAVGSDGKQIHSPNCSTVSVNPTTIIIYEQSSFDKCLTQLAQTFFSKLLIKAQIKRTISRPCLFIAFRRSICSMRSLLRFFVRSGGRTSFRRLARAWGLWRL